MIDPHLLRAWLGKLAIMDVLPDRSDLHIRLWGTEITKRYGREMGGGRVSEISRSVYGKRDLVAEFMICVEAALPVYDRQPWLAHNADYRDQPLHRLALPYGSSNGDVQRLLVLFNYTED